MKCIVCKKEFEGRKDAKYCSVGCRKKASRDNSILPNKCDTNKCDKVILDEPNVTDNLEFEYRVKDNKAVGGIDKKVYKAKYWYQVPLGAVPVLKEGFPKMPDYMNGRQYFLWWKNKFKEGNNGAVIYNPYKQYDNVQYVQAGETSRRWGS